MAYKTDIYETELSDDDLNKITPWCIDVEWYDGVPHFTDGDVIKDYSKELRTLKGIIEYAKEQARQSERSKMQREFRNLMGI